MNSGITVQSIPPIFGTNYDVGHIGFTYVGGVVSTGVAYFERWNRIGDIRVTHTFVVIGDNECIEAHIDEGVARVPLSKYLNDPGCRIFFRKPRGWTPALGQRIAATAASKLGCKYDTRLIAAEAAAHTVVGHWLNRVFGSWPNHLVSRVLDRPDRWICSELVAYALQQQPELQGLGVLRFPPDTIDPQELFEDHALFEDAAATRPSTAGADCGHPNPDTNERPSSSGIAE
ncbi:MAG: hypothetical protein JWR26_2258 [Pedosphaera sp.]|nr:hypothetical protein [Pedosphaera sp.]